MVNKKFKIVRHLLLQLFLIMLCINSFQDDTKEFKFAYDSLFLFMILYIVLNFYTYINILFLIPKYYNFKNIKRYIRSVILLCFSFVVVLLIIFIVLKLIGYETTEMFDFFTVFIYILGNYLSLLFVIFTSTSFIFIKHSLEQKLKTSELKNSTFNTELKMLKQQINPHFLFNMINNINVLTFKQPIQAQDILFKLEELLKYQFNDSQKDEVYLKDDVEFLRHFLNLEDIRRTNFTYRIDTEGDIFNIKIPPLLFIPFVENAVKHNGDPENSSFVNVKFIMKNNTLFFECINSKSNYYIVKTKVGGIGLINIRRRLELLYPNNHTIDISDKKNTFEVRLKINYIQI
ncbi:MAG: histidine kinase [Bacteroidales bacterium]|nr:histidine kinase [Bacteroidales bacterium]